MNNITFFFTYTTSLFKEKMTISLTSQQKKIVGIAFIAFNSLLACYMLYRRYCFKAAPIKSTEEWHFNWKDVEFLAQQHLGMRHVSSRPQALAEATNGFVQGCSLSISPQYAEFDEMKDLKFEDIPINKRNQFVKLFEKGIDHFIYMSLIFDLNPKLTLGQSTVQEILSLINKCSFSLVTYNRDLSAPCDFSSWGEGLGRYPKISISNKDITLLAFVEEKDLGYSDLEKKQVLSSMKTSNEIWKHIISSYRKVLIQQIRAQATQMSAKMNKEE